MSNMIHISNELISQIEHEAENTYPNECCGFIFGSIADGKKYAEQVSAVENSFAESEKYHRFIITPEEMMKAELFARSKHWEIIGFYHSHPDCPAVPSGYDTTHALPVYSYMIVSAVNGKAVDLKSWELDKEKDYLKFAGEYIVIE